ncbi:hypothetical protein GW750_06305 [bacterium]|nr:hypothetical protein [bacterium]
MDYAAAFLLSFITNPSKTLLYEYSCILRSKIESFALNILELSIEPLNTSGTDLDI